MVVHLPLSTIMTLFAWHWALDFYGGLSSAHSCILIWFRPVKKLTIFLLKVIYRSSAPFDNYDPICMTLSTRFLQWPIQCPKLHFDMILSSEKLSQVFWYFWFFDPQHYRHSSHSSKTSDWCNCCNYSCVSVRGDDVLCTGKSSL